MRKVLKQLLCITLVLSMVIMSGCGKSKGGTTDTSNSVDNGTETSGTETPSDGDEPKEIVTLRFGTHYVPGLDPHYTDDVTGEYVMPEADREARLAAEEVILNELGVVFEYVQFAGNTTEVLLQSVMANDPICDIAWMWGGSESVVLGQNILQKLDDYAHLFEDDDYSWMFYDKVFGHHYFLGAEMAYMQKWPLVFNIDYIEAVDSLKDENGNTIYPTTLFEQGKWTWSTFKDYLQKIEAFYAESSAPNRPERRIDAYQTDYRFAALSSVYSAGGAIYGPNGLQANSDETKKGVAYIKELMEQNLLTTETYDDGVTPGWLWGSGNFQSGESVFTDIASWYIGGAVAQAGDRGQSIGVVPWPREDSLSIDDEKYKQVMTRTESMGILKGISPEKTELALKALRTYWSTYYKNIAGVDSIAEYRDAYASTQAAAMGFDIFHETAGDSILESFKYLSNNAIGNDYADLIGVRVAWDELVANSLYGVNGTPSYDVAVEANMQVFNNIISDMTSILSKEGTNDNIKPGVKTAYDEPLAIPVGTTLEDPIWAEYIQATDNMDGALDISTMKVEFAKEVDFNTVGLYDKAFKAIFTDSSGNTGDKEISFILYDPNNTTPPTITAIAEPATVAIDTNVADIKWMGSFIESAVDANGFDVSRNVTADISELDTTSPGSYEVKITVTDFVGNTSETVVTVVVAAN